jgi:hypothetical protein
MRRMIGVAALLALAACSQGPPDYYVREACKSAGFSEGTQAFDSCVAEKRMAQLRQVYDLGVRDDLAIGDRVQAGPHIP